MASVRAFSISVAISGEGLAQEEREKLREDDVAPGTPPVDDALYQRDQARLQAVWEHGIAESPLPPSLEAVRQKYKMAGRDYDYYWRIAAASQLSGERKVKQSFEKARRKLRSIEQTVLEGRPILSKSESVSTHSALMREAQRIASETHLDGDSEDVHTQPNKEAAVATRDESLEVVGDKSSVKIEPEWLTRARETQHLLDDVHANRPKSALIREVEEEMGRLRSQITRQEKDDAGTTSEKQEASGGSKTKVDSERIKSPPTKRALWRQRKQLSSLQEKLFDTSEKVQTKQQAEVSELKTMLESYKKQLAELETYKEQLKAYQAKEMRRFDSMDDIRKRKLGVAKKKEELRQQITVAEEKEPQVNRKTKRALAQKKMEESFELGDILTVAVGKTAAESNNEVTSTSKRPGQLPVILQTGDQGTLNAESNLTTTPTDILSSSTAGPRDSQEARPRQQAQTQHVSTRSEQSSSPRRASDHLRLNVPSSGVMDIDSDLAVSINAETPGLQSQIFHLHQRLKASYPRISALPYDIWESENRKTLQTWLKILAKRWQMRFDDVRDEQNVGHVDQQVQAVLDQMVRDHELSNEGAKRMAMKWLEIFNKRGDMAGDAEGTIDWDEIHAGGMSFLQYDEAGVDQVEDAWLNVTQPESKTLPLIQSNKRPMVSSDYELLAKRLYSTSSRPPAAHSSTSNSEQSATNTSHPSPTATSLPHLTSTGSAHMVSVSSKPHTIRTAIAIGTVYFSNATPLSLIRSKSLKKGDVLSVSRIAGIMAAKKCPDLIPLCHPIPLTHVGVELRAFESRSHEHGNVDVNDMGHGGVAIEAKVSCTGPTGVEMEALTSVMGTALSVVDMCKAVDKFQRIQDVRVVLKEGGKSGVWKENGWRSWQGEGV